MKLVSVSFDVNIPDDISDDEIEEWLRFNLHDNGEMSADNPLVDTEIEPYGGITIQVW